ncbi:MAG TPA: hypothetical protein VJM82_04765 [Nitrospiraceae bacterium]|nr:hypothetical protein [Nitrospiraceae bacterium]
MQVTLAVIADSANVSQEGKLNIMGIFDALYSETFPTIHPEMKLVVQLEAGVAEVGKVHQIEIQLMDEDGRKPFVVNGQVVVGEVKPGTVFKTNSILNIRGVKFEQPGDFVFNILLNGELKRQVPLKVMQVPKT